VKIANITVIAAIDVPVANTPMEIIPVCCHRRRGLRKSYYGKNCCRGKSDLL